MMKIDKVSTGLYVASDDLDNTIGLIKADIVDSYELIVLSSAFAQSTDEDSWKEVMENLLEVMIQDYRGLISNGYHVRIIGCEQPDTYNFFMENGVGFLDITDLDHVKGIINPEADDALEARLSHSF